MCRELTTRIGVVLAALWLSACGSSAAPGIAGDASEPGASDGSGAPNAAPTPPPPMLMSSPLAVAQPIVVALPADTPSTTVLQTSFGSWRGELARLAGTAHYDRGEWIYEDYPWTAWGAATPGTPIIHETLDALGLIFAPAQRLPGGLAIAISQAGAGPLVDEADIAELRMAVRDSDLHVMVRTTTMHAPVRTGLLLLFDTGRAGSSLAVPFGAGLSTTAADVAVLVTADGARIVDMLSGAQIDAPAAADPTDYLNVLEALLPLAQVSADGEALRFVAATGLVAPGAWTFDGGGAGPVANVVPRFDEPVQATYDRQQAVALANGNIDGFFTDVSLERMRAGDSERLLPGIGYSVRTFDAPASRGSEGGTDGVLRQYGLYLPATHDGRPAPATIVLRGSSMTAHAMAAVTPGLFHNLGDGNGAVVISPCGRSGFDGFQGVVYEDVLQTLADAKAAVAIDPERLTLAGYSMGGYATYMFAATRPDLFAGAFVIAGPVGGSQPATTTFGFPDVVPMLANLLHTPVGIFHGDVDVNVPITNALAATKRLGALGYRYRFNILLANTHFSPGIQNDYSIGARYLQPLRRVNKPARVHFVRSMPYERAVDTAIQTDQRNAGQATGLRFDKAWFVHDVTATDPVGGVATVDVATLARPAGMITPVMTAGVDTGPLLGQAATPYQAQSWHVDAPTDAPRNALRATLSGVAQLRLDLAEMALTTAEPLTANVTTDAITTLLLTTEPARCVTVREDGGAARQVDGTDRIETTLAPGDHLVELAPCQN